MVPKAIYGHPAKSFPTYKIQQLRALAMSNSNNNYNKLGSLLEKWRMLRANVGIAAQTTQIWRMEAAALRTPTNSWISCQIARANLRHRSSKKSSLSAKNAKIKRFSQVRIIAREENHWGLMVKTGTVRLSEMMSTRRTASTRTVMLWTSRMLCHQHIVKNKRARSLSIQSVQISSNILGLLAHEVAVKTSLKQSKTKRENSVNAETEMLRKAFKGMTLSLLNTCLSYSNFKSQAPHLILQSWPNKLISNHKTISRVEVVWRI